MIDKRDVDLFLKAKKDQVIIDVLMLLASICLMVLLIIEGKRIHGYSLILVIISFFLVASALGAGRWKTPSREDLLKAMERMINSDAEALKIIAEKNKTRK